MPAYSSAGESSKSYEVLEAGVYPARCYGVIELGTHNNTYQGVTKKRKELMIFFETGELMQDGRPFIVKWQGTNTLSEKGKLNALLSSWRGRAFTADEAKKFSLGNILGKCCMVNVGKEVSQKGKDYNKLISIMPMPKGMPEPEQTNEQINFGIGDYGNPDEYNKLYPWIQTIIEESDEAKAYKDQSDDLPFS